MAHKGRGAVRNTGHRFEARSVVAEEPECEDPPAVATVLRPMPARTIISHNQSPDIPFDRSINPYVGCEHGCVYCYARPSHSYLDLSPGLDFETQIFFKPNARERLVSAWQRKSYECQPITIGANTDPYQPAERKYKLTRALLETFLEFGHPVSLISKGVLMRRDLDLLGALAERKLCSVAISMPTMDDALKRILEPRVPAAAARLRLIRDLTSAGVPVSVLVAPVIPAVNDREIEQILSKAADAGATRAAWILLRLPHELKTVFADWLDTHLPERAAHVMSLIRQSSGGRDYDHRFGRRQFGSGPYADMIAQRYRAACARFRLATGPARESLDCTQFRRPGPEQLSLRL